MQDDLPFPFPPREGAVEKFPERPPWDTPIFMMSNWWLTIQCSCGKGGSMHYPLRLMAARAGWRLTLRYVVPRLKCHKCNKRPARVLLVDTPQGDVGRYGAKSQQLKLL